MLTSVAILGSIRGSHKRVSRTHVVDSKGRVLKACISVREVQTFQARSLQTKETKKSPDGGL